MESREPTSNPTPVEEQQISNRISKESLEVLVVDGDPATYQVVSEMLSAAGLITYGASTCAEGIAFIKEHTPHFLITDWEIGDCSGLELCRGIRELELPHYLYTLFLTDRNDSSYLIEALENGADDYLTKPVGKKELLARLNVGSRALDRESRFARLASTDALTNWPTRRGFLKLLKSLWHRSRKDHFPLSCVLFDIDYFKRINDTYGHRTGDDVLCQFADLFREHTRDGDLLCRMGGEEFCVILPDTTQSVAYAWAEQLRIQLQNTPLAINRQSLTVTASFGVSERLADMQDPQELLDMADQCLLAAKEKGRNHIVTFSQLSEPTVAADNSSINSSDPLRKARARDAMTAVVNSLKQDSTVQEAAEFFLRFHIGLAPVVDEQGCLIGIVSEKDVLASANLAATPDRKVTDFMRPNALCYDEDTPLRLIYEFLCRVSIRSVLIVNQRKPTGFIERASLLRWFSSHGWAANTAISNGFS